MPACQEIIIHASRAFSQNMETGDIEGNPLFVRLERSWVAISGSNFLLTKALTCIRFLCHKVTSFYMCIVLCKYNNNATLAQLVEQLIRNQ
jgi:hypothetical protein